MEYLWCLGIWEDANDYILCAGDEDMLPKLYKQDEIRYEYNQNTDERGYKSCTIFGAMGMLSDLKNYQFTYDQIKEVDDMSYTTDKYPRRMKNQGRYVKYAVWLTKDRRNASPMAEQYGKVAYYRINKSDSMIETALDNLYTLDGNLCPTKEYIADYKKDAMVDGYEFWAKTNGHCVDIIKEEWRRSVKDSYKGRKTYDGKMECNIYGLKNELKDMTNYGDWFYIFTNVSEDNLERIKELNTIKSKILQWIPINSELWHLSKSDYHKAKLHNMNDFYREWLEYINNELKRLS